MSENIPGRKLLVISDTPVCRVGDVYMGYEPVVRELEALAPLFDEITWLACTVKDSRFSMRVPDAAKAIKIIPMPSVLARFNFLRIPFLYPFFFLQILKLMKSATHIHTRGPSHPALAGIMLSLLKTQHVYWHKYAGNWVSEKLALTYRIQRKLLKLNSRKTTRVTVNGGWNDDPAHVLSFENPCLFAHELRQASAAALKKNFSEGLTMVFVGNLTPAKGILELIEAINDPELPQRFKTLFIVGGGELSATIKTLLAESSIDVHITGPVEREELNRIYARAHIIILPSLAEGFPKVIAEGAAFGCVPIVTDISSVPQYVNSNNGYLLPDNRPATILNSLKAVANDAQLETKSINARQMASLFTYERFINRIKEEVLNL